MQAEFCSKIQGRGKNVGLNWDLYPLYTFSFGSIKNLCLLMDLKLVYLIKAANKFKRLINGHPSWKVAGPV